MAKLIVYGVNARCPRDTLESEFARCGDVTDVYITEEEYAFVTMADDAAAAAAIKELNGAVVDGQQIKVDNAYGLGGDRRGEEMNIDLKIKSIDELMTNIQCHVCKAVPRPATDNRIYKCFNEGHPMCNECRSSRPACPCGSRVCAKNCKITQILLQSIPWCCLNYKHGCRETFQDETAFADHQIECIYRQVRCCHPLCDQNLLFKNYLDHFLQCCSGAMQRVLKSDNASILYQLVSEEGYTYFPYKIEAHGSTFFLIGRISQSHYRMWMLMLSSSADVVKNHEWKLKVNAHEDEKFTFCGKPFTIDKHYKEVLKEQQGFSIGCNKAWEIKEKLGKFEFEIKIRNLKEEAKDEDMESGVATDSE